MKIQAVRGMRDFYPDQMALRNWLTDIWRTVSRRHGFQEYDSPILEYLDLYQAKSGDEIVEQLFHLTDRGGRELALRPETTPALARMISARANALARPIKWFSISRCCRAERPQRGRTREFFQWNLDVVGTDDLLADAECILTGADCLRQIGLHAQDVVIKISDRRLIAAIFEHLALPADRHQAAFAVLDKATRLSPEALAELWSESIGKAIPFAQVEPLLHIRTRADLQSTNWSVLNDPAVARHLERVDQLFALLDRFGVGDYCDFDARIVRSFAYYTGPVYEAFDRAESLRALLGGGRYDNLLAVLGGPRMSGTGMGMGDVVILELLSDLKRLPATDQGVDIFLVDADPELFDRLLQLAGELRRSGFGCQFSYKRQSVSKQLAAASARGARRCAILGQETRLQNAVTVKDLTTGQQKQMPLNEFLSDPMKQLD